MIEEELFEGNKQRGEAVENDIQLFSNLSSPSKEKKRLSQK